MTRDEEKLQSVLDKNVPSYLHADTEMRRLCQIIATTEDEIENNPIGDSVLLEPDDPNDPDQQPYYKSERMLLLEACDEALRDREGDIQDLEIEAFLASMRDEI